MIKDNDINVSKMTEDALDMSCLDYLDYGSYPVSTCSISMHEIKTHTQGG